MTYSINTKTCVALVALIAACTVLAPASARAESPAASFAFVYDAEKLDTAEGRRALDNRLAMEANTHCRNQSGNRASLSASMKCRGELVSTVQSALNRRAAGGIGGCIAIALSNDGATPRACTTAEHALGDE